MNCAVQTGQAGAPLLAPARPPVARRVLAIDAMRGLTILVMIFVNALAGVRGMPAWLDHAPAELDGMTFPDVVFPAFLFIVGMSIPFAVAQRQAAGDGVWRLQGHMLARAAGLLALGVFMVNAEAGYNEAAMGFSIHLWSLLFYSAAILLWNVYRFNHPLWGKALRLVGLVLLLWLALAYRAGPDGNDRLAPQWWGILGLIGWAYLYASLCHTLARGRPLPLLGALAACVALYCLTRGHAETASPLARLLAGQAENAIHTAIALAGVCTSLLFFERLDGTAGARRYALAAALALALAGAGWLLRPYFGISKIHATPSWALYSAAICILLFGLLYWLIDLRQISGWTGFFRPAAGNPLLAYIIPYIVYALLHYLHIGLPSVLDAGLPGLLWSLAYAIAVLYLVRGLNRLQIRLQL
ncbi:hypothetical protein CSQ96_28390 [Janthinobacterium sp. BJB412]|nr:hypothetical protein CSQ96_28390 [Janthinobacterium sp. BJB412]